MARTLASTEAGALECHESPFSFAVADPKPEAWGALQLEPLLTNIAWARWLVVQWSDASLLPAITKFLTGTYECFVVGVVGAEVSAVVQKDRMTWRPPPDCSQHLTVLSTGTQAGTGRMAMMQRMTELVTCLRSASSVGVTTLSVSALELELTAEGCEEPLQASGPMQMARRLNVRSPWPA